MNIERFHNQLALHLGYERILDRNIDIHVDDSGDAVLVTIEVKNPSMKIRFSLSELANFDNWSEQLSLKQEIILESDNLKRQIDDMIYKIFQAYTNVASCTL